MSTPPDTVASPGASSVTLPASCGQERLWFLHQWEAGRTAYNVPLGFDFSGPLDLEALRESCLDVVRRHEVLRTTFHADAGELLEVIHDEATCAFEIVELSELPPSEREPRATEIARELVRHVFDLECGPLMRFVLLRFTDREHRLLINAHHIICDGWSFEILLRDLAAFYRARLSGQPAQLDPLPIQYGDYAAWQRDWLKSPAFTEQLDFWKEHLRELPEPLALPTDRPATAQQSAGGAEIFFELPTDLTRDLETFGRQQGQTLYFVVMAAFQALLHRWSGQEQFLVGAPVANRSRTEVEDLIGFFVNTVVLRADFAGSPSFRDLLTRVRTEALGVFAHADLPFERLIEQLQPERRHSRNPLFRSLLVLQEQSLAVAEFPGLQVRRRAVELHAAKFDLLLELTSGGETLRGCFSYSTDLFDHATIDRLLRHFTTLLREVLAAPDQPITSISLSDRQEQQQVLTWSRGALTPYPATQTIHAIFEQRVAANHDALAVVDGELHLSYAELNERANRLAHRFRAQGIREGDTVGLFAQRNAAFLAAVLGILKVGAAYVPLDPRDPPARLAALRQHLSIVLDEIPDVTTESADFPPAAGRPEGAAYVMFTSGSTGEPKGVIVPHQGVTRLVCATDYVQFNRQTVMMQGSNLCFDASTFEIWGALLHGGTLVLTPQETLLDHTAVTEHLARHAIDSLFLTTSLFNQHARQAPEMFAGLRCVVFGGEAADPAMIQRVLDLGRPRLLVNGYGPTETTTFAVCHRLEELKDGRVPIGRPIANTDAFILDASLRPVPIGVTGEIYVGGPGVALGYLQRPELTAERFLQTPLGRLYRTGDFGRWLADGTIEYQGRLDQQLKIRGFRIEPAEIEAQLRQHPAVAQCAVLARASPSGEKILVAYFVRHPGHDPVSDATFREYLLAHLPPVFVPSQWFWLDALPLTANGKLDQRALPNPDFSAEPAHSLTPAQNSVQNQLIEIWEEVLQRRPIGIRDDFFALGGHSLLVARMLAIVEERLGVRVPFGAFFKEATIERMAVFMQGRQQLQASDHSWVLLNENGTKTPLFFLHGDFNGGGFFARTLARHSGGDRRFYAMHPDGLHGDPIPSTIQEMAALKLQELRRIQPEGPYFLGGYCNGSLVAFEMARRIEAEGGQAPVVVMLYADGRNVQYRNLQRLADLVSAVRSEDATSRQRRFLRWRENCGFLRGVREHYLKAVLNLVRQSPLEQVRRLFRKSQRVFLRLIGKRTSSRAEPEPPRTDEIFPAGYDQAKTDAYAQAVRSYVPGRFGGRLVLLWPRDEKKGPPQGPAYGWSKICHDVRLVPVPGEHDSCIERDPNLREIGRQIGLALAEIESRDQTKPGVNPAS